MAMKASTAPPVRIAADLDPEVFERLSERARKEHRSIAAEVRVAIDKHLEEDEE